ncbi:MAG TPA: TolC family protein [Candidatus Ozemobacteraceae bacterium]|nr:TolC family protein [Candidatus Ozemobacteraceae bacterium]
MGRGTLAGMNAFFSKRTIRWFLLLTAVRLAGIATPLGAQPASGPWTLEQCLEYGLRNHPTIRNSEAAVNAAQARIGSTRSGMGTKMNVQSAFTRNRQEFRRARSAAGISGSDDLIDSTSSSVTVRKTLTDAGQTSAKLNAARRDFDATRSARTWDEVTTAVGIKTAYYRALQAMAQVAVQRDLLHSYEVHLEKVRGFVDVGSRAPYDITKALVDVANTKVAVIKAESEARNLLSALAKAVGFEGTIDVASQTGFLKLVQPELDTNRILEEAFSRADLRQAQFKVEAARQRLVGVKRGMNPSLSGSAGYDWNGTVSPLDRSWSAGLQLSIPVLDGKLTRFSVEEQRNGLEQAKAALDQSRLAIRVEVETAITGVRDAFQRLEASEILFRQAAESLSLAEGRFDAGLGSPIEITDARAAYSSARGSHVTAYYDSLIALANLDRALGLLPPEVGGVSAWTTGAVTDETVSESDIASFPPVLSASEAAELPEESPATGTVPVPPDASIPSPEEDDGADE